MSDSRPSRRVVAGSLAAPLADLLRALCALRPRDEVTLAAILDALGYGLSEEELARATLPPSPASPTSETKSDAAAVSKPPGSQRPNGMATVDPLASEEELAPSETKSDAAAVSEARYPFPSEISVTKPPGSERPNWTPIVDPLATASDHSAVFRVPMATLLLPRRERAVLIHAAGQRRATGEIDLDQIIGAIAANNPLEVLPRQSVFTLREGVQLLCDSGPGMEPFALDVAQIADAVRAVAGRDRVSLAYFLGCHCAVWFDGETAGTNVIGHPLQVNLFLRCRISACFGQQVADELRSRQRNGSILICCFGDAALR